MNTDNRCCVLIKGVGTQVIIAFLWAVGLATFLPAQAIDKPPFEEIVHLSCIEAWQTSNEDIDTFVLMVNVLAEHSLAVRGLRFPDTSGAGERMGEMIDNGCRAAPDNVLFNEVDKAIRAIAK